MNKLLVVILLLFSFCLAARDTGEQLDERLTPEIEAAEAVKIDYSQYPTVRLKNNKVSLNNDDWSALGRKYRAALKGDSLFTVVYLGDSHVQADFGGSVLRTRLSQNHLAGRGIIIPFRLAGTNEPFDYSFTLTNPYTSSKLMKQPWTSEIPFTGIALHPDEKEFTFGITSKTPAQTLRFHTFGADLTVHSMFADSIEASFDVYRDADSLLCVSLTKSAASFEICLSAQGDAVFAGVELLTDSVGVMTHSIGNNGATFSDYSQIDRFGSELAALHPDLVVVALGTNEAFSRISMDSLRVSMDDLLNNIRTYNPTTKVLIVGPAACYKKVRRKRRRIQVVNQRVPEVARSMRLFAEENGIPYYNHYAVAGSAVSQRKAKLLGRDGIHYTANGYRLWGNLLSDAILEQLNEE